MHNHLEKIVAKKQEAVDFLKQLVAKDREHVFNKILAGNISHPYPKNFKTALKNPYLSVIAEIKRKSPSKGVLGSIENPVMLANQYSQGGANAISVLTEEHFFAGTINDLQQVASALKSQSTPILRKDFILDDIQIAESIAAGANAILCMVSVLGQRTKIIMQTAKRLGLDVLVEVINQEELAIAIDAGAEIIAINNRNLITLEIDQQRALNLVNAIPQNIIKVAASGMLMPEHARACHHAGFDAVLIGEALVKSEDPATFIHRCQYDTALN